ncbi:MAG: hypothetical protein ACXWBM_00195 [Chthoniobacterales bacterium]
MTRRLLLGALTVGALSLIFTLTGCTTVETRIAEKPEAFHRLSPADQAAVQQGKIREGLSMDAVYIAWGPPSMHIPGRYKGSIVDTWVYDATAAGDYPGPFYYGYPYGYGAGYGFYGGYRHGFHRHFFYDPFYDPYFYSHANIVRYPERTVSFQNGRVIAFQFLPSPRFY